MDAAQGIFSSVESDGVGFEDAVEVGTAAFAEQVGVVGWWADADGAACAGEGVA